MNTVWVSVFISFFISLIVSSITFIFGLRAGKNQVDRLKLKDIYRELHNHFDDLLIKLIAFNPKRWCDFPEDRKKMRYITLIKKLKEEGYLLELPKDLSQKLENLELKYLQFSFNFFKYLINNKSVAIELLKEYSIYDVIETKNSINSKNKDNKSKHFEEFFGLILSKDEVKKICSRLNKDNELGICLILKEENNYFRFYIYPNSLNNLTTSQFILKLSNSFLKLPDIEKLLKERKEIIEHINKIIFVLKNRTIDPHPFWQTIKTSILDIFKKK